ncbi:lipase/acyltransferase domain-containing protein [Nocardia beijingensis]|uniref:lipase/acyltransferase domain-containing protein n=1 Tax=Nocardia beijingensis TaxID=95162 RepID=UPI0018932353|nr:hypothetical protein [Nocardia beijingensis]MBF6079486.1 hypothetical protein [Nocardia beijingensis]
MIIDMQQDPHLEFYPDADLPSGTRDPAVPLPYAAADTVNRPMIADAIVVIPGIMGTELVDTSDDRRKLLWGLDFRLLSRLWMGSTTAFERLKYDPERTTIVPGRLLRRPAYAPFLKGIEPYTKLVHDLSKIVRRPDAVLEYGYDWRLPVRHNAELLARAIDSHLTNWRRDSGRPDAKVHLVAHSMGGLLCRALAAIPGAMDNVGVTITLGTPFEGAALAMVMIGSGEERAFPAHRMRELARNLPGIYDLLPAYPCVEANNDVRVLTVDDVVRAGGDRSLAEAAFADRGKLARVEIPNHRGVVGIAQPTICTVTIDQSDRVRGHRHTFQFDEHGHPIRRPGKMLQREAGLGDGTVPRASAAVANYQTLPQQHGALAKTSEACADVADCLHNHPWSIRLAGRGLGLELPDSISTKTEFEIGISGTERVTGFKVRVTEAVDDPRRRGRSIALSAEKRDGRIVAPGTIDRPGIYRVSLAGAGTSPVTQLVLVDDGGGR